MSKRQALVDRDGAIFVAAIAEMASARGPAALPTMLAGLHAGLMVYAEDPERGAAALHIVEDVLAELRGDVPESIEVAFRVPLRQARADREAEASALETS